MSQLIRYFLLLFGWTIAHTGLSQPFGFENFSVNNGLAQSQVYAILEDSRGYIWMGTRGGGVCRFDGKEFETFNTSRGLVSNYISALFEDNEGNIWIGTNRGLSIFDGIHFDSFLHTDTLTASVEDIIQKSDGNIYVGTDQGLFIRGDGNWEKHEFEKPNRIGGIQCLYEDVNGQLWIGHGRGITRLGEEKETTFTSRSGLKRNLVYAITESPDSVLWVGAYQGGLHTFDGTRFQSVLEEGELKNGLIFDMLFDDAGILWIGTQNAGVAIWNPVDRNLSWLTEVEGLPNNQVKCMIQDSWGNHWFGTSGGGTGKYSGKPFIHYGADSGLGGKYVYSVIEDTAHRLWMGVSSNGVTVRDSTGFTYYNASNGFKNEKVKALFQDSKGRLWLGTEGEGVAVYTDSVFYFINGQNGLSDNWVRDIIEDREGRIWVATAGGGITRIELEADSNGITTETRFFRTADGLRSNRINCLHLDKWGRVWYGTRGNGIGYLRKDSLIVNIPHSDGLLNPNVRSFAEDNKGFLWIGTAGGGVSHMYLYEGNEPDDFKIKATGDGLTSGNVYLLEVDDEGFLWIGTETGMDRATLDFERNIINIDHYGMSEGFIGIETCQNAVTKDQNGNLWIGTINGLAQYNPRYLVKNTQPPRLSISRVQLFYTPLQLHPAYLSYVGAWGQLKPGLKLPFEHNHLGFEFKGIDHFNPNKILYQWKLRGAESDWSPASRKEDASYSNLPAGKYTFMVQAINGEGLKSEISEVSFEILPPYWQTWWFLTATGLTLFLAIVLIFRLRLERVRTIARIERERLEMEKGLIQLEQKALRLQMNPHFIFNALNSIQSHISSQDTKTARYYLAKFSRLMRSVLENSRETMIPLVDEIHTLENYLEVERFSGGEKFDYEIEIDPNIDPEEVLIPSMMIQPFIENAIIHGIAHLKTKGHIHVRFIQINKRIECSITDSGVGRQKAAEIKSQQNHRHKSTALLVTQERLDIISAGADWGKSIEFIDLKNSDGSPAGTRVILRIPLIYAAAE